MDYRRSFDRFALRAKNGGERRMIALNFERVKNIKETCL